MKNRFPWDAYSDQPYPLKDRAFKKHMKRQHRKALVPLFLYNLFIFPLATLYAFVVKGNKSHSANFFGLCINLDKGEQQLALIEELGCHNLQLRFPLNDIENIESYIEFAKKLPEGSELLLTVLQDQEKIDDHQLLVSHMRKVFEGFSNIATSYQIGNAINRSKWGFFSTDHFLGFYQSVQKLRDSEFPSHVLIGPSVIDYEYHFTIRALFNRYKVNYDKLSSLLYVDRRGAPENRQMVFFDTSRKIDFLYGLTKLSAKTSSDILITEANWPISNTAPWAPTSETECVDEDTYANYLLRYYLLALASKKIEAVYWHQLIAPGYGLVDSREGVRKREAFYVFKFMLETLKSAEIHRLNIDQGVYSLHCSNKTERFSIQWVNSDKQVAIDSSAKILDKLGNVINEAAYLSHSPVYIFE